GDSFNEKYWSKIPRGTPDWKNYMSDEDTLYAIRNNKMILRGLENDFLPQDTVPYLTGGIYTKDKKAFGFGRWEIHAKLNAATGAWPAFWLLPQDEDWPYGGEVDIMERLNNDSIVYQTVHSHYTYNLEIKDPQPGITAEINPDDFNTYAVELHPDRLDFFVNEKKTFSYPKIETTEEGQFPFDQYQFYLLVDMQLGGNWVGEVDPADLPVEMEIDWVKFYSFEELYN